MRIITPVSYTHLDVYKRQVHIYKEPMVSPFAHHVDPMLPGKAGGNDIPGPTMAGGNDPMTTQMPFQPPPPCSAQWPGKMPRPHQRAQIAA